jgi:serine protease AprX
MSQFIQNFKYFPLFILFTFSSFFTLFAQASDKYWVYFTDKGDHSIVNFNAQELFTEAALERRQRQGVALDFHDLPVYPDYVNDLASRGVSIGVESRWLNAVSITVYDDLTPGAIAVLPYVKKIEPVRSWRQPQEEMRELPSDLRMAETGTPAYGAASVQVEMIGLDALHGMGYTGEGLTIAVLDGGFMGVDTGAGFQALYDKDLIKGTFNFPDGNEDVYYSSLHGSYVLSIMGADVPGTYVGACPGADYYLFRTEVVDSERVAEEDFWLAAAEYADFIGADIINSSLGYTTFDVSEEDHSYADMDGNTTVVTIAADMAASRGILVCNSAGNSGNDPWKYIGAPADGDSVFSIGAVDAERIPADFSSEGPTVDGRVKPNIAVMGDYSSVLHPAGIVYVGSGTSFSSPLAAGAVACLWQAFPEKTNWEIMQALQKSASRANDPDNKIGYGIPNMVVAYHLLKGTNFDELSQDGISLFPNPVRDVVNVVLRRPIGNGEVLRVTDMQGRLVLEQALVSEEGDIHIIPLNTESWTEGVYLLSQVRLEVGSEEVIYTTRIVKQ